MKTRFERGGLRGEQNSVEGARIKSNSSYKSGMFSEQLNGVS